VTLGVEINAGLLWLNPIEREVIPLELGVDVNRVCVEDAAELGSVVLDSTGEMVLPPDWANTATEIMATATIAAIKANRFFAAGLVMDFLQPPHRSQSLWRSEETSARIAVL